MQGDTLPVPAPKTEGVLDQLPPRDKEEEGEKEGRAVLEPEPG